MSLEGPASPPALISVTHESVASGERRQKGGYGCRCGQTVMDDVAVGEERDRVEELCGAASAECLSPWRCRGFLED